MQFILHTHGHAPDLAVIERELRALDPAALCDLDGRARTVRIATSATARELLACLRRTGAAARAEDLDPLPSECCGGCGG